ncbi:MAG: prepilin-type N-terminal cleavage/methylation domain-containing protein [Candidatus Berkelbacteria bacterium]|nr:MAG: prepilin-type N-terminal cleavage/methylation domain-containing protein [Candidatus Berkelbacteria bacterium]QQG51928.1 MAG: prepilin-type N-terminal cleavage/methylation domain-containing protein [Candidatus Berkelbacteria bacterium]
MRSTLRRGFTLVEVLTVVSIIGILVTITTYMYNSSLVRSRDYQRITDLQLIKNGLEQYYLENRHYPPITANPRGLFIARWQLEKIGGSGCPPYGDKEFLAPVYVTTIPQDPVYQLHVGEQCYDANFGQFIYTAVSEGVSQTPKGFYLMGRLERSVNMSDSAPDPATDLKPYSTEFQTGGSLGFKLCDKDDFVQSCSHNFYLKNN